MKVRKQYELQAQLSLPFLSTSSKALTHIFNVLEKRFSLKKGSTQKFIDLGAGNGNVIVHSALNYSISSLGIEINEILIDEIKERIKILKEKKLYSSKILHKIVIKKMDLFQQDLSNFDFVYLFSLPTMQKYLKHVFLTAKEGAIIISYKYPLDGFDSIIQLEYVLDIKQEKELVKTYYYKKVNF
ncbi:MAG: class I SAM-dependent methyltransferase [Candidatus Lokiarchaeota archaeon]|nr:class I SAM-dependent methyltransferase [Candidatus Lokiarchaeota archaeon]